jgi:hypothetical protein
MTYQRVVTVFLGPFPFLASVGHNMFSLGNFEKCEVLNPAQIFHDNPLPSFHDHFEEYYFILLVPQVS